MDLLQMQCKALKLPIPVTEFIFHPTRKWRIDYYFANHVSNRTMQHFVREAPLAVEIEGGIWIKGKSGRGGAHSLPSNIVRDMEKSNEMQIMGISLLRFQPEQIKTGEAALTIKRWFMSRGYESL